MRIALISTPFVPVPPHRYGGTELIVSELTTELAARGHEIVVYATGDSAVAGDLRFVYRNAVWPPDPYRELVHVQHAIYDLVDRDRVDIVHAHLPAALPFARLLDAPLIYTIHHDRQQSLCDLYAQARGVTLVAVSERQRELLSSDLQAVVVHHGLDPRRYPPGTGGPHAAFVGRFAREKGVHDAIDAARRAGIPIQLGGAAHWVDHAYFRAEVAPRLAKPGVTWLGEVALEAKLALFGGALATLFPIAWEEPFGVVMVESMLCGTPVVAFPRGSAPEVIDEGITGWLVHDVDEMAARLLTLSSSEPFDRARCRAHAMRRFSAARMVDDYLALYVEALGLEAPAAHV